MTMNEFWPAFLANEYAVRCGTQTQHDQFVKSYEEFSGEKTGHKYIPSLPYLYHTKSHLKIAGWTGLGTYQYGKIKITFQDWLASRRNLRLIFPLAT